MAVLKGVRVVIADFNPVLQFDNDRYGSQAVVHHVITRLAAFGQKQPFADFFRSRFRPDFLNQSPATVNL